MTNGTVTRMREREAGRDLTVADLTPEQFSRVSTSFHEAGHAVMAVLDGGQIGKALVSSSRWEGLAGAVVFSDWPLDRGPTLLAGAWAEAKWCAGGQRRPSLREVETVMAQSDDLGERSDRAKLVASGTYPGDLFGEVSELMSRCWPSVLTLAIRLFRGDELRHSDVTDALGIPAKGNGFHRSLIRSGATPGAFNVSGAGCV